MTKPMIYVKMTNIYKKLKTWSWAHVSTTTTDAIHAKKLFATPSKNTVEKKEEQ